MKVQGLRGSTRMLKMCFFFSIALAVVIDKGNAEGTNCWGDTTLDEIKANYYKTGGYDCPDQDEDCKHGKREEMMTQMKDYLLATCEYDDCPDEEKCKRKVNKLLDEIKRDLEPNVEDNDDLWKTQGQVWTSLTEAKANLTASNNYTEDYKPYYMMDESSNYWCSEEFGANESHTTTIAITFDSTVSATGFRVKPYKNYRVDLTYPMFANYTVKVDGVEVENEGVTRNGTSDDWTDGRMEKWTEYAFSKKLEGSKFELIGEMSSDASHNYTCIKQLEMLIIGGKCWDDGIISSVNYMKKQGYQRYNGDNIQKQLKSLCKRKCKEDVCTKKTQQIVDKLFGKGQTLGGDGYEEYLPDHDDDDLW